MRPEEREAVVTTIVGGRPPGCGRDVGAIPRGIETLIKKATVDPDFRALLLARRAGAADSIGLALSPAEAAMLGVIPPEQLERIIEQTEPPATPESRRAFLGSVASAMLAALTGGLTGCDKIKPYTYGLLSDAPSIAEKPAPAAPSSEPGPHATETPRAVMVAEVQTEAEASRTEQPIIFADGELLVPHEIKKPKPIFTAGHDAMNRRTWQEQIDKHGHLLRGNEDSSEAK